MNNILLIGNGGREHAISWKLSQSPNVNGIYIFPGNTAIESATSAKCAARIKNIDDHQSIIDFCQKEKIGLVIVGPEAPLANGIVDSLETKGIPCFGPSKSACKLEWSKAFAKEFMIRNEIPTAKYRYFNKPEDAKRFLQNDKSAEEGLVVKASGLALGKGVIVADNVKEAIEAVDSISQYGNEIILEERLIGEEISALCFTDGRSVKLLPFAQDHKRLLEDDQGPNTGGMGAYAPYPFLSTKDVRFIENEILLKTVTCLRKAGIEYKGVLYAGLILTDNGPKVLEFNCRLGDPETQVLMPLLRSDLFSILNACVQGGLGSVEVSWDLNKFACGVVLASGGYPNSPDVGYPIEGISKSNDSSDTALFYAGMKRKEDGILVNSGGRVLCAVGIADTLANAAVLALNTAKSIHFNGRQLRTDIGRKALKRLMSVTTLTYKDAGVDIDAGDALVDKIEAACASTARSGSDTVELGGFGASFDLKKAGFKDAVLVSGTDGVGTKLAIAQEIGYHETVGIDLVAMCVNDILTQGAEPLFFLDYYATGKLKVDVASHVIKGIAAGCKQAGCSLIGGETAEMPGFYSSCEYDLAGFAVGAVEREVLLNKPSISIGDVILGLPSSGLHSNGFSLVRKIILEKAKLHYSDQCPWNPNVNIGQALLIPTKIYVRETLKGFQQGLIKAAAHITGGGLVGNIPRVLPAGMKAVLDIRKWHIPQVFTYLQQTGNVPASEMMRTFNCGVGLVLVASNQNKERIKQMIRAENGEVFEIGTIQECRKGENAIQINGVEEIFQSKVESKNGTGKKRVAVLISGSGTNLQALIDYTTKTDVGYEIVLVLSNVADVKGLERAQRAGITTKVISHVKKTREVFEDEIHEVLIDANIELICLAGFMRILTEKFVRKWTGQMINTHPSLLPSFKGAHAHQLALESGVRLTGCSIHFVEPEVDAGAIILQGSAPVYPKDTEDALSERVKMVEHRLLPRALDALSKGQVRLNETSKAEWSDDQALVQAMTSI